MMRRQPEKLLYRAQLTKKIEKNAKILLKLFFFQRKIDKVIIAGEFSGVPTAQESPSGKFKTPQSLQSNETHKRKSQGFS